MCFNNNNIASSLTNTRSNMDTLSIAKCFVEKANSCKGTKKTFTMTFSNFANLKQQTHCAYSGIKFQEKGDFSFSFERIDNSKGYEDGNVIPVCRIINNLRSDIESSNDVEKVVESYQEKIKCRRKIIKAMHVSMRDIEKTKLTETKPIIRANRLAHFTQLYNVWKCKQTVIKTRRANITKIKNILLTAKKPKTIQSREIELEAITKALNKDIQVSEHAKTEIEKLIKERKSNAYCVNMFSSTDYVVKHRELKEAEQNTLENIATYERMISHFKYVKQGLQKFENLSSLDKICLRIGYPLDTPRSKVIKQAMAMKLSNEVW